MTSVHRACVALLFSVVVGIGTVARADPNDVKGHLVRVSPWPVGEPARCGTGLVIEGRNQEYWLLTAEHNLGSRDDGGVVLYSKRKPEGVVIEFEVLYKEGDLDYSGWVADDIALVPLTNDALGLVDDDPISIAAVPTGYIGGNFTGEVVGVSDVTSCGPPDTWKSIAVPLEEPRRTPAGKVRIRLPSVETGPGGSGSPVVTPITGHVVGVYVGGDGKDGSVIWLKQSSVTSVLSAIRNAEIPIVDVAEEVASSFTLGVRLLSSSVGVVLEQQQFVGDLGAGAWLQQVLTYFEKPWLRFDNLFLGADVSYRFGFDRLRYSVRDPTDHFTLEEVDGPYHVLTSLLRVGIGSRHAGRLDLSLGGGVLTECPFTQHKCHEPATAKSQIRERLGFASDVRLRIRLLSWLGVSVAGRFELVPGRELHVERILTAPDPEKRRPLIGLELAMDLSIVGSLRDAQVR